mmetsp:Transcript_45162/g.109288  ORF Transcript_45162/g.109288 Transcript_45162/m.109288 type:complete len:132 (+) Transcript_45162:1912-2307(+)
MVDGRFSGILDRRNERLTPLYLGYGVSDVHGVGMLRSSFRQRNGAMRVCECLSPKSLVICDTHIERPTSDERRDRIVRFAAIKERREGASKNEKTSNNISEGMLSTKSVDSEESYEGESSGRILEIGPLGK